MAGVPGAGAARLRAVVNQVITHNRMQQAGALAAKAVPGPVKRATTNELAVVRNPEEKLARRAVAALAFGVGAAVTIGIAYLFAAHVVLAVLSSETYGYEKGGYFGKTFPPTPATKLLQGLFS